jgi:hypothetical protein
MESKIHCPAHNILPVEPVTEVNPFHIFKTYFCKIHFNIIFPHCPRDAVSSSK